MNARPGIGAADHGARGLRVALQVGFALLLSAGSAAAQTKTGTTLGQFLMIEPNARVAGMGNAGVSLYDGLESVYYNTAAIGSLAHPEVQFTHSAWLAGITYDHIAGAMPISNWGTVLATVTALNSGDIDVRTVEQPLGTGERYRASDIGIGVGFGRQISSRFAVGAQLTWLQETIWNSSASTAVFDIGTLYRTSPNGLHLGASLSHYGTSAAFSGADLRFVYDNDPTRYGDNGALPGVRFTDAFAVPVLFRVGVGWPIKLAADQRLRLALDAFHPSDNTESMSAGAEWMYKDLLALRTGYQNLFQQDSEVGLTLGAGVRARLNEYRFKVDYAWADQGRLESTQRLTLGVMF